MIAADLGRDAEAAVAELIRTGRFADEAEVLREGIRLLEQREARRRFLDAAMTEGIEDAEAGRTFEAGEVFGELKARYEALVATQPE